MNEKVSICIPCYNNGEFLADAITSALNQDYPNIEIIVSNNCSTDQTAEVLESFALSSQIISVNQPRDLKMTAHWNQFRDFVTGDWIIFLCADDILGNSCVSECMYLAKNKKSLNIPAVFFEMEWLWQNGGGPSKTPFYQSSALLPAQEQFKIFLRGNNFPLSACMLKKQAIDTVGWFDNSYDFCSDWYMWLALTSLYEDGYVGYIKDMLGLYRRHTGSVTHNRVENKTALPEIERLKNYFIERKPLTKEKKSELKAIAIEGNVKLAKQYAQSVKPRSHEVFKHYMSYIDSKIDSLPEAGYSKGNISGPPYPTLIGSLSANSLKQTGS